MLYSIHIYVSFFFLSSNAVFWLRRNWSNIEKKRNLNSRGEEGQKNVPEVYMLEWGEEGEYPEGLNVVVIEVEVGEPEALLEGVVVLHNLDPVVLNNNKSYSFPFYFWKYFRIIVSYFQKQNKYSTFFFFRSAQFQMYLSSRAGELQKLLRLRSQALLSRIFFFYSSPIISEKNIFYYWGRKGKCVQTFPIYYRDNKVSAQIWRAEKEEKSPPPNS